jgi:V/A-type H+-transporting ATPase subunit B
VVGPGRTRADHLDVAAQSLAALAHARQVRELAELIGETAVPPTDRAYLTFADRFEQEALTQRMDERRGLDESLDRCRRVLRTLPEQELTMLPAARQAGANGAGEP